MKILKILSLSLISLSLLLLIYYQFDEELNPEIKIIMNHDFNTIPINSNAYFHLLGLYTEKDKMPHAAGLEIIKSAQLLISNKLSIYIDIGNIKGITRNPPNTKQNGMCNSLDVSCISDAKINRLAYIKSIESNKQLLSRYRELFNYRSFEETLILFGFEYLIETHRLFLTDVALLWLDGDRKKALEYLQGDIKFWSMLTKSDISLVTRMLTAAILERDLKFISGIISDCKTCDGFFTNLSSILLAIEQQDKSFRKVFAYEFRQFGSLDYSEIQIEQDDNNEALLMSLYYKKNAMQNKIYEGYSLVINNSECPISNYIQCYEKYSKLSNQNISFLSFTFLSDPIGSILSNIASPNYSEYVWQTFKLEAIRRLVLVKNQIYIRQIQSSDINSYLASLPAELASPFLNTEIKWSVDKNSLEIDMGKAINDLVSIAL